MAADRDRHDEQAPGVKRPAQRIKPRRLGDHGGLRQSGRHIAKGEAREIGRHADGRVAQEQARDQHRDAVARFTPGGEHGVESRAKRRCAKRHDGDERARTRQDERQDRS